MADKNKKQNFFKKVWNKVKSIPWYGWVLGLAFMGLAYLVFIVSDIFVDLIGNRGTQIQPIIPIIDNNIPLVPYFFAEIYVIAFVFWTIATFVTSLCKKEHFIDYSFGILLSYFIGFIFFIAMPTYIERDPAQIEIVMNHPGFSWFVLRHIWTHDGLNVSLHLFPSFHVMCSVVAVMGMFRRKEVSLFSRVFTLVFSTLVCLSTLFTKQHFIADVIIGIALPIGCFSLMKFVIKPGKRWVARENKKNRLDHLK